MLLHVYLLVFKLGNCGKGGWSKSTTHRISGINLVYGALVTNDYAKAFLPRENVHGEAMPRALVGTMGWLDAEVTLFSGRTDRSSHV